LVALLVYPVGLLFPLLLLVVLVLMQELWEAVVRQVTPLKKEAPPLLMV